MTSSTFEELRDNLRAEIGYARAKDNLHAENGLVLGIKALDKAEQKVLDAIDELETLMDTHKHYTPNKSMKYSPSYLKWKKKLG